MSNTICKKLLLLVIVLTIVPSALLAQFKVGPYAGYMLTLPVLEYHSAIKPQLGVHHGFEAGLAFEYQVLDYFALQTGVGVSMKGYDFRTDIKNTTYSYYTSVIPLYLDFPLYAVGKFPIADEISVMLMVGPRFGCGIYGTELYKIGDHTQPMDTDVFTKDNKEGFERLTLQRFNLDIHIGAGIECYEALQIKVGYNFNVINNSSIDGFDLKQNGFVASLTYFFTPNLK